MRFDHPWLFARAGLFFLIFPGTVLLYVPRIILSRNGGHGIPEITPLAVVSIIAGIAGIAVLCACVWDFAAHGRGTLAPVDPPGVLVVRRLYRYTRNPMYLGVITVIFAESGFFASVPLVEYAAVVLLFFHLFVVLYEEKVLAKKFGAEYERYRRAVPRWGLLFKPYRRN